MSFNTLLGAALHCNEFQQVVEIFHRYPLELGFQPNVASYNTVIRAIAELGLVDEAVLMVDEMEMKGLEPNLVTFNSLVIGAYGKKGFLEGERVWHLMLERISGLVPDIRSYNAKLQGMISEGMVFDAVVLFEEVRIKGLDPNTITYNHLIKGFCDKGDLEEAKKWYTKLLESGWFPNGDTFRTLIRLLCENGDSDLALGLSKRILGRYFVVDQDLLQMVVDTLVKDSKVEDAKSLVKLARSNCFYQYNLVMSSDE